MSEMTVHNLRVDEILSDPEFNCRGAISAFEVNDLVQSIRDDGLQTPITVKPYNKDGYKWIILAGHRRHMAFQVLEMKTIPAFIKEGMSEEQCIVYNLNENLKRKELNPLQEAIVCDRLKNLGHSLSEIAHLTKTSLPWVHVRLSILELEPEIQREVAAGIVKLDMVKRLARLSSLEQQQAAVKKMKEEQHLKRTTVIEKPKNEKKARTRGEINIFQEIVMNVLGEDFSAKCLAWAQGEISDKQIHIALHEEAKIFDKIYTLPIAYRDDFIPGNIQTADKMVFHNVDEFEEVG